MDCRIRLRIPVSFFIRHTDFHKGDIASVRRNFPAIRLSLKHCGTGCRHDSIPAAFYSAPVNDSFKNPGGIYRLEEYPGFLFLPRLFFLLKHSVYIKSRFLGIRVYFYGYRPALISGPVPAVHRIGHTPAAHVMLFPVVFGRLHRQIRRFPQAPDYLSPVGYRPSVSQQVHIPAIRRFTWILRVKAHSRILSVGNLSDSGFPQVIPGRPGEIPDKVRMFLHQFPVHIQILGKGFRTHDNPVRIG